MIVRYVAMARPPRGWQTETAEMWQERPTITVWEAEPHSADTGLLDATGTRLYRVEERAPIGFRPPPVRA